MIGTSEVDDSKSRMNTHSMVGISSYILANECKPLYENNERTSGIKGHSKNKKKEGNTKMKQRVYHLQDTDNVKIAVII